MDEAADGSTATECLNCGAVLRGDFCYQCGQAAKDTRRLFIGLVQDVFVETLAIDGKLFRSIALLLWRPGRVARRFLDGRRVHYSPPFRLYLFTSVFFFIAAFAIVDLPNGPLTENEQDISEAALDAAEIEELRELANDLAVNELTDLEDALDDMDSGEPKRSFQDETWEEDVSYSGPAWLEPHVKRMYEAAQRTAKDPRLMIASTRENLPRFLLIAPVIYALTLMLLYFYRRKYLIYDHFIVSLYMHAALYAYLLLALLLSQIPVIGPWLIIPPLLWAALQPFAVFRQAYASNWFSVVIKGSISLTIYLIVFSLIITLGLSFALYQS